MVRDNKHTWPNLTHIQGLGVPTATTLLAACWPDSHAIIDRRDMTATIGLNAGTFWSTDGLEHAHLPRRNSTISYWQLYSDWFRDTILLTAHKSATRPVQVERALYCLHDLARDALPEDWTCSDYHAEAVRQVDARK